MTKQPESGDENAWLRQPAAAREQRVSRRCGRGVGNAVVKVSRPWEEEGSKVESETGPRRHNHVDADAQTPSTARREVRAPVVGMCLQRRRM